MGFSYVTNCFALDGVRKFAVFFSREIIFVAFVWLFSDLRARSVVAEAVAIPQTWQRSDFSFIDFKSIFYFFRFSLIFIAIDGC